MVLEESLLVFAQAVIEASTRDGGVEQVETVIVWGWSIPFEVLVMDGLLRAESQIEKLWRMSLGTWMIKPCKRYFLCRRSIMSIQVRKHSELVGNL